MTLRSPDFAGVFSDVAVITFAIDLFLAGVGHVFERIARTAATLVLRWVGAEPLMRSRVPSGFWISPTPL
jgi:hypothetical protein